MWRPGLWEPRGLPVGPLRAGVRGDTGAQSPADASTGSLRGAATSAGVTLPRRQPNGEEGPPLSLLPGPSFELI